MSITTTCPSCQALFRLPESLSGKAVRCQKCGQMFRVPGPLAEPPAPAAEPPAPPIETVDAAAPALQPADDIAEAALAPETPADDIVEATLAPETPPPGDDVVEATLAEPKTEKPRQAPAPERAPSNLVSLALLMVFLFGLFSVGLFAVAWTVMHLGPPVHVSRVPIRLGNAGNQNFGVDQKFDGRPNLPAAAAKQILLGFDGKAVENGVTDEAPGFDHGKWNRDGPYRLYRVQLQDGNAYHFFLSSFGVATRLRIVDGDAVVAEQSAVQPNNRLILGFQPKRTGEHLLWVTTQNRNVANFFLSITRASRVNPAGLDLRFNPNLTRPTSLRLEDPLDKTGNQFGTCHDYNVTFADDQDYVVSVVNAGFVPVLRIDDNQPVRAGNAVAGNLTINLRSGINGKHRIRVTSEQFGLGNYTLKIEAKPVQIQRILATLDDKGTYESKRAFAPADPKEPGWGSYKEYLIGLEEGKRYRFELTQGEMLTRIKLFDPKGKHVASTGVQNFVLHRPDQTGTYRVRVFAPLPKDRAEYTFRVTTEP